ncbi:hypothetical protein, partial [Shinella yambaruensis]|uniref:hypothetical protein n=1 Tax=Shinella yambaruensis TaxID=415996 RepID=UPI0024E18810
MGVFGEGLALHVVVDRSLDRGDPLAEDGDHGLDVGADGGIEGIAKMPALGCTGIDELVPAAGKGRRRSRSGQGGASAVRPNMVPISQS